MVALLVILAALGFFMVLQFARKRRSGFAGFAARRGLRYETSAASLPLAEFTGFSLFHTGWESRPTHLIFGRYGDVDLYLIEFIFKSGPQMNDPETTQTMLAIRSDGPPPFRLGPASPGFGRTGYSSRGKMSLDADAWPEEDRQRVFSDSLLERATGKQGWHVEGNGNLLVLWQASRVVSPEEIGGFLDDGLRLARGITSRWLDRPG